MKQFTTQISTLLLIAAIAAAVVLAWDPDILKRLPGGRSRKTGRSVSGKTMPYAESGSFEVILYRRESRGTGLRAMERCSVSPERPLHVGRLPHEGTEDMEDLIVREGSVSRHCAVLSVKNGRLYLRPGPTADVRRCRNWEGEASGFSDALKKKTDCEMKEGDAVRIGEDRYLSFRKMR